MRCGVATLTTSLILSLLATPSSAEPPETVTVSGVVVTDGGAPVKGVVLTFSSGIGTTSAVTGPDGWVPSHAATTDADGNYTLTAHPGAYRLAFIPPGGLPPVWYLGASTRDTATPVVTTAGSIVTGIDQPLSVGS